MSSVELRQRSSAQLAIVNKQSVTQVFSDDVVNYMADRAKIGQLDKDASVTLSAAVLTELRLNAIHAVAAAKTRTQPNVSFMITKADVLESCAQIHVKVVDRTQIRVDRIDE